MSVIQHRVAKLEAIHGKAGSWDAIMMSLADDDLRLTIDFIRHRLQEPGSASATAEPELDPGMLTGAHLQEIVAQARPWAV